MIELAILIISGLWLVAYILAMVLVPILFFACIAIVVLQLISTFRKPPLTPGEIRWRERKKWPWA